MAALGRTDILKNGSSDNKNTLLTMEKLIPFKWLESLPRHSGKITDTDPTVSGRLV